MAGTKTEGEELRKLLKYSRKRPLPFGFCIGPSDEDHLLIIHRKRKPAMLGKAARAEGLGSKIAFGTLAVTGRLITLTCEQDAPALAGKMKRFMLREKLKMNILVLNAAGRELDSDIEDLEQEPARDRDEQDAGDDLRMPKDAMGDPPGGPTVGDGHRAALVSRLKAIQPRVRAATGERGEKLRRVLVLAAARLKAGDLAGAARSVAALEKALAPSADGHAEMPASLQQVRAAPG